jgi:hypothetical protein
MPLDRHGDKMIADRNGRTANHGKEAIKMALQRIASLGSLGLSLTGNGLGNTQLGLKSSLKGSQIGGEFPLTGQLALSSRYNEDQSSKIRVGGDQNASEQTP